MESQKIPIPYPMKQESLVELRGISKSFGESVILDGLDLSIYPGEALVIIGPSGTGKSTVLRLIAGLIAPDAGEIYLKGQLRQGLIEDREDLIRIALVFQQSALFDSLTVEENIGFFLHEHSHLAGWKIKQLVTETLQMVGLGDIGHLYPEQLSGGMRKRVSFARSIIANPDNAHESPELILYDEPTAGLDPISSRRIENLVRNLQKSLGTCSTYIMVSHQESTIRHTADRVVFLYDGKVQWDGAVSEIDTTANEIVRQFFSGSVEGPIRVME